MLSVKSEDYEIYSFLDNSRENHAGKIIDNCVNEVPLIENIGYAGYNTKIDLTNDLDLFLLDKKKEHQFFSINKDAHVKILKMTKETLEKLKKYKKNKQFIFIFPCFDNFTLEKMNGSGGFCPKEDVILLFLNINADKWENNFPYTIAHEFAHSISPYYKGGDYNIGQGLIFEGLAEHFRENVLGGDISPLSKAISEKEILKYVRKIRSKLTLNDLNLHFEIFFGQGGKYPLWTGYSIGYYFVKKYLNDENDLDWNTLLRKNPEEILEKIKKLEFA